MSTYYSKYIFESEFQGTSLPDTDIETLLADDTIKVSECEEILDMGYRAVAENTINFNKIMEACNIMELGYLAENGTEMVYESGNLDGFFNGIKKFFLAVWEKIKGIFKKALVQFSSWTKSDADFISKYKKQLNEIKHKTFKKEDLEVSIYNKYVFFNGSEPYAIGEKASQAAISSTGVATIDTKANELGSTNTLADWDAIIEKYDEEAQKDDIEKARGSVFAAITKTGENASRTTEEFKKDLVEWCQGGETSKESVKLASAIDNAMSFLEKSAKIKNNINKALNNAKSNIDFTIKCVDKYKEELSKTIKAKANTEAEENTASIAGRKHTLCGRMVRVLKEQANTYTVAISITLSCLKSCSRQSKSVCAKALTSATNESSVMQSESGASLLESIDLI